MMGHGRLSYLQSSDERPKITRVLIKRVMDYAKPYRKHIFFMLFIILISTGISLVSPLIMRDLIDRTLPEKNLQRLILLTIALLFIPVLNGGLNIIQRRLNAGIGEGVIYDLRVALFSRLQRMSLSFFTHNKIGELMSRLNNDVVGAQTAISSTITSIVTNLLQAVAIMVVMLSLEWRLTLLSVFILPLLILVTKRLANQLRDIARKAMETNARMNAMMNETLNIGGAILVKLFG
ncbi:MAG: ABC transporter ATP-binding protein, partial [Anaerolineaceae bacterium]|nr:ABC transporter ATP-binding protein [Anaerolineaceae bacterium]